VPFIEGGKPEPDEVVLGHQQYGCHLPEDIYAFVYREFVYKRAEKVENNGFEFHRIALYYISVKASPVNPAC
jgi:hypothetical protein